jgi:hypothetical protein
MLSITPQEVMNLTGINVTESGITSASGVIELYCGRPQAIWSSLKPRDRRTLKLAVIFQAAWLASHPEAFTAVDAESYQQLDQRVDLRDGTAMVLAPLAKRALRSLSWRATRSIPVDSAFQESGAASDYDAGNWQPL